MTIENTDIINDKEVVAKAFQKATDVYIKILKSYSGPEFPLDNESLEIFKTIKNFGLLDHFKVNNDLNSQDSKAIIIFIAKDIYNKLKLINIVPQENKKSKWEVVMGKTNIKRPIINNNKRK
jgi:hypothetical protein